MRPTPLVIEIAEIPPEGLEVDAPLEPGEVHVEGEDSFSLQPGGSVLCRVEKGDDESVHVRGRLQASLGLACNRCLEPFAFGVAAQLDLIFLPRRRDTVDEEEEVELSDHELVVSYYGEPRVDLGETVREQLFLSLPMKRLCREGCLGLCPLCGANRNQSPCACKAGDGEGPLVSLRTLLDRGSS